MQETQVAQSGINVAISMLVRSTRNPRTYFDEKEMAELTASVRAQGVLQPLLVRPTAEGKLEIVAGERRWRAAQAAGLSEIPVLIREMTDEQVDAASLTENVERAAMSPAEEAEAAARVLGNCAGNRDEAAKRLGWSRTTLDKRLALMNSSASVRKALNERKISLGHAELLAAVARQHQDGVLGNLLAAPEMPTVAQVKAMLEQIAQNLDTAIFNKDGCVGCPNNSGTQQALFGEAIAGARCTNAVCFNEKTEVALAETEQSLKEDFPTVRIVRQGENFTILKLVAEGSCGVGEAQAKQCRGCANFGAAISAVPGKVGNVYRDQCFDPACNATKVAERLKAEKEASEAAATTANAGVATAQPKAKAAGKTAAGAKSEKADKPVAKTSVADSQRIKDYRATVWRKVFKLEAQKPEVRQVLLVTLALEGKLRTVGAPALCKAFGVLTQSAQGSRVNLLETASAVRGAGEDVQSAIVAALAASCFETLDEIDIKRLLTFMQANLGEHWVLNAEYLDLLTKSEIQVIAEEIGLIAHLGEKFGKMLSGKKDELIKSILAIPDFDFAGKVPRHLMYDR